MKNGPRRLEDLHVLIESAYLEALKREGARRSLSLSDLVRQIIAGHFEPPERRRLMSIAGSVRDAGVRGAEHDEVLYGRARRHRR